MACVMVFEPFQIVYLDFLGSFRQYQVGANRLFLMIRVH